jgi:flagellin-like hook-associated protein FlgL
MMNENINENENSVKKGTESNIDVEKLKNLTNTMDLNSIMQLASTLLKNESIMNSVVGGLSKNKQNSTLPVPKVSEKKGNIDLSSLNDLLEKIANDLSVLKQENAKLGTLSQKLDNIENELSELRILLTQKN